MPGAPESLDKSIKLRIRIDVILGESFSTEINLSTTEIPLRMHINQL